MLSGGPNWELQANVILAGTTVLSGGPNWKNLHAKKIFAGDNLGGVGVGLRITRSFDYYNYFFGGVCFLKKL